MLELVLTIVHLWMKCERIWFTFPYCHWLKITDGTFLIISLTAGYSPRFEPAFQTSRIAVSRKKNSDTEWQVKISYIAGAFTEGNSVTEHVKIRDKSPPVPAAGTNVTVTGAPISDASLISLFFWPLTVSGFLTSWYMYWITLSSGLLIECLWIKVSAIIRRAKPNRNE